MELIKIKNFLDKHFPSSSEFTEDVFFNLAETMENELYQSYQSCCFDNGASKGVIIPKDNEDKYVLKIPFNGYLSEDWDDEELTYAGDRFIFFDWAPSSISWDYCSAEVEIYEKAEELGIEQLFAKTEIYDFIQGYYPIYIQEKAVMFFRSSRTLHSEEKLKETSSKASAIYDYCSIDNEWLTDVLDYYGEEKFITFLQFLKKQNINDLHSGNIGYIDGRPVVVDYSGYYE